MMPRTRTLRASDQNENPRTIGPFEDTAGDDVLIGRWRDDLFLIHRGGDDQAFGGKGNDIFSFEGTFDAADRVDGGKGSDILELSGDYAAGVTMTSASLVDVEIVSLGGPFAGAYRLAFVGDLFTTTGLATLTVFADRGSATSVDLDASQLTGAWFWGFGTDGADTIRGARNASVLSGGGGGDVLIGGAGFDVIAGGIGSDLLTGGDGEDMFSFHRSDRGRRSGVDTILDFTKGDTIDLADFDIGFHMGGGGSHVGEILVRYQPANGMTVLKISTDADAAPELVVNLAGDHRDLTIADFVW